jgi:hypothetical protein
VRKKPASNLTCNLEYAKVEFLGTRKLYVLRTYSMRSELNSSSGAKGVVPIRLRAPGLMTGGVFLRLQAP